jgi:hypothetical protein
LDGTFITRRLRGQRHCQRYRRQALPVQMAIHFCTCFKRAAMKTNMRQTMLAAAVHTAAYFYFDLAVIDKIFVFVVDHILQHLSHGHAVTDAEVTGIGTGAGSYIGKAVKARCSKI